MSLRATPILQRGSVAISYCMRLLRRPSTAPRQTWLRSGLLAMTAKVVINANYVEAH